MCSLLEETVSGFSLHPSLFQRFVFGIKNAAEQTRQTQQSGNGKSTTSSYDPLSRCANKFSNVLIACAACTESGGEHYSIVSVCSFTERCVLGLFHLLLLQIATIWLVHPDSEGAENHRIVCFNQFFDSFFLNNVKLPRKKGISERTGGEKPAGS